MVFCWQDQKRNFSQDKERKADTMQATIRTSMNTVRRHLYIAATVQGLVMAVVSISIGALLPLTAPPAKAVDVAAPNALKEQRIAEIMERIQGLLAK